MKSFKNNVVFAALLLVVGNMQGMENIDVFPFTSLPRELQQEVMVIALNNEINSLPIEKGSLQIAAQKIRDLASVNKAFNAANNQPKFCLQLIKNLTKFPIPHHRTADLDVAKMLGIRCAQERFKLQKEFMDYIKASKDNVSMTVLENFIRRGVDLDFSGDKFGQTPLIEAVWLGDSPDMVNFLIKKGANINEPNFPGGVTPLYFAVQAHFYDKKAAQYKERQIKIITMLLEAGADPDRMTDDEKRNRDLQERDVFKEAMEQIKSNK
ncbi:MAG TPA: ankyrin repeat domain-containing protein [Candidatus Babeliales bacterium]|nr:ankyrin repeat domain-containing protein [Candidatus Babeliales bacterium]